MNRFKTSLERLTWGIVGTYNSYGILLVHPTSDILNPFCWRLMKCEMRQLTLTAEQKKLTAGWLVWAARLYSLFVFNFLPKRDHVFRRPFLTA